MSYKTILAELEEYCGKTGLKPSTVCVRALNDSRYVTRHLRRIAALDKDAQKIRNYMAAHPAPENQEDAA
ncbi:XRE family transcriptional regulator [Sulfitobacter pontiacus]